MKNIVTNKLDTPWYYIGPNVVFGGLAILIVAVGTMGLIGAIQQDLAPKPCTGLVVAVNNIAMCQSALASAELLGNKVLVCNCLHKD